MVGLETKREYYRLLWEYIKRSEIIVELRQHAQLWNELKIPIIDYEYCEGVQRYLHLFLGLLLDNDLTFDEHWQQSMRSLLAFREMTAVRDGFEYLQIRESVLSSRYKWPKYKQRGSRIKKMQKENPSGMIVLAINTQTGTPVNDILNEIRTRISAAKKEANSFVDGFQKGTKPKDLQRYLSIYDKYIEFNRNNKGQARHGTWPYIISQLEIQGGEYPENTKRSVIRDYQKALKIIKNVEKGEFPGKY